MITTYSPCYRHPRHHRRFFLSGMLLLCTVALSIAPIDDARANILEDLLDAAMKYDNQLLLAEAQLNEAKARAGGAAGSLGPTISARYQSNELDGKCTGDFCTQSPVSGERSGTSTVFSISQPLYEPELHSAFRRDKANAEQQGYLYATARMDVFQRLLSQYLDILRETDRLRTLRAQRETLATQVNRVAGLVASGVRRRADLTEARAAADLNLAQVAQSEIRLRTFYEGLSESTKLSIKNLPPIRKDVELPKLVPQDPEHWKQVALDNNFALLAARKGLDAARFELRRETYGAVPRLEAYADWTESDLDLEGGKQQQSQTEMGIRFNWNIYEGRLYSDMKIAKARQAQTRQQLQLTELEIKTLVPSLVRLINRGRETIDASLRSMQAKETVAEQINYRYLSGTATITESLEAYDIFYQAERDYYESLYTHIANYADFYVRTGTLNEETLRPFYDIADFTDYDANRAIYLEEEEN